MEHKYLFDFITMGNVQKKILIMGTGASGMIIAIHAIHHSNRTNLTLLKPSSPPSDQLKAQRKIHLLTILTSHILTHEYVTSKSNPSKGGPL